MDTVIDIDVFVKMSEEERNNFNGITISSFSKAYRVNGLKHRIDGPAHEHRNGYKSWWYHGQSIDVKSQEEFESWLKVAAFE